MKSTIITLSLLCVFLSCDRNTPPIDIEPSESGLYFPPTNSSEWETITTDSLNWDMMEIENLYTFLEENNTRAFILLKDGKMILEQYWGKNFTTIGDFDEDSQWYWASAGKTITSTLVGIAQQEGFLDINNSSSTYLGSNWTSLTAEKEELITVKNQLTMTTGLDYSVSDNTCYEPECLLYLKDAGTQWFYHNAPYTLLQDVVANATDSDFDDYTRSKIEDPIGMDGGDWIKIGNNKVYWSTARDMARYGLLILNQGKWGETEIINKMYYDEMVNTSQDLNPSYGYLWWLNGKSSIVYPGLTTSFNLPLAPQAPEDLFAAMGKNGQFIDVIPSQNLVVIRMGEAPDESLVPAEFHDDMWGIISKIIE